MNNEKESEIKSIGKIIEDNLNSATPLQDFCQEKGLDEFYRTMKLNMSYGEGHEGHISKLKDIDDDTKEFLDSVANQLNKFFMGNNSKEFWYESIEFKYCVFSGYQAYIKSTKKYRFERPE